MLGAWSPQWNWLFLVTFLILCLNLDYAGWYLDGLKPFCVVKKEQGVCSTWLLSKAKVMFPVNWGYVYAHKRDIYLARRKVFVVYLKTGPKLHHV